MCYIECYICDYFWVVKMEEAAKSTPVTVKVIFLGEENVGKSSILLRFKNDKAFNETYVPTIGVSFGAKIVKPSKTEYKLQLWDTAGQESYRSIMPAYIQAIQGVFLVYDVTNKKTFSAMEYWKTTADKSGTEDARKDRAFILIGNKVDQSSKREVTTQEGQAYADSLGIPFFETSAKDNINIDQLPSAIIREVNKKKGDLKWWQKE